MPPSRNSPSIRTGRFHRRHPRLQPRPISAILPIRSSSIGGTFLSIYIRLGRRNDDETFILSPTFGRDHGATMNDGYPYGMVGHEGNCKCGTVPSSELDYDVCHSCGVHYGKLHEPEHNHRCPECQEEMDLHGHSNRHSTEPFSIVTEGCSEHHTCGDISSIPEGKESAAAQRA